MEVKTHLQNSFDFFQRARQKQKKGFESLHKSIAVVVSHMLNLLHNRFGGQYLATFPYQIFLKIMKAFFQGPDGIKIYASYLRGCFPDNFQERRPTHTQIICCLEYILTKEGSEIVHTELNAQRKQCIHRTPISPSMSCREIERDVYK